MHVCRTCGVLVMAAHLWQHHDWHERNYDNLSEGTA